MFLLVCAAGLVVDPLFFYSLSISGACMCLFVDGWFAVIVTALRCMADAVHLLNMCLQMSMAYNAMRRSGAAEKDGSRSTATRGYLRTKTVFVLDLFIILPVPQVVIPSFSIVSTVKSFQEHDWQLFQETDSAVQQSFGALGR